MKIALTTIGSRGDIQPYIALGIELLKQGHSVVIITHPWAKQIVSLYGLTHISVGDDIDINYSAKQFVENSSNNLKGFKFALNFIFNNLRNCHKDLLSSLKDFDLIIGHGIVGEAEADILDKPFISVSIAPMGLPKEYWKSKNIIKELSVFLSDKIMGAIFGKPYLRFRKDIGAPPLRNKVKYPYLALIPMPLFLQKPNPNWKNTTEIIGFLFAETPNNYSPPEDLLNFMANGEKSILITFGSMFHSHEQTKQLYKTICEALVKSESRAILIMADLNEEIITIPKNVFIAKQIPYSWLLGQVEIVVHHFGFGTTAEVLKAGLPSIPIPHIFDQKIRASAIHKLGYATRSLNINHINSNTLSNAIVQVKNDQKMKRKCKDAGIMILNEKGTDNAVRLINKYIDKINNGPQHRI
jgi:UDP:flavonoid glycosyltransferase YjiC (YdhE family)